MRSLSLVMSECFLSGRGQGHVSNFYIVDFQKFTTASRRYTGDIHNSTVFRLNSQMKRSDFHLGKSQRVVVASPCIPLHAVSERWVVTAQVSAVQVGVVAVVVPPGTFVQHCTRLVVSVVVLISSAELVSTLTHQRITCKQQVNTNQLYD